MTKYEHHLIQLRFQYQENCQRLSITWYGPSKHYHRENFFQSLTIPITSNQNTIFGGDFNMITEFRDRTGDTICHTHLLGSIPLNELLKNQNLQKKYTLTKLIIHITEHYPILIVDWIGFIPLKILIQ